MSRGGVEGVYVGWDSGTGEHMRRKGIGYLTKTAIPPHVCTAGSRHMTPMDFTTWSASTTVDGSFIQNKDTLTM